VPTLRGTKSPSLFLRSSGMLRAGLDYTIARDTFWTLTRQDLPNAGARASMVVLDKYEDWLADTIVRSLVGVPRRIRDGLTLSGST
jgi:hypothetical protein